MDGYDYKRKQLDLVPERWVIIRCVCVNMSEPFCIVQVGGFKG